MSTTNQPHEVVASHGSGQVVTVYINGTPKSVVKEKLTFEDVVALAFDNPPTGDGVQFTVQYSRRSIGSS
jgi:hypothetical protein